MTRTEQPSPYTTTADPWTLEPGSVTADLVRERAELLRSLLSGWARDAEGSGLEQLSARLPVGDLMCEQGLAEGCILTGYVYLEAAPEAIRGQVSITLHGRTDGVDILSISYRLDSIVEALWRPLGQRAPGVRRSDRSDGQRDGARM